jgi:multidrug resistance efflux pump
VQYARWLQSTEARIEGQVVEVTAGAYGCVDRIAVAAGGLVERGELLVELDHRQLDRNVAAATAEMARALETAHPHEPAILARVEIPPTAEVTQARKRLMLARLQRMNAEVRAPVAGRVLAVRARQREYLDVAQPLLTLLESDYLWVLARFVAPDFARLRLGQSATVSAGGRLYAARISGLIGPEEPVLFEFIARPVVAVRPGMPAAVSVAAV